MTGMLRNVMQHHNSYAYAPRPQVLAQAEKLGLHPDKADDPGVTCSLVRLAKGKVLHVPSCRSITRRKDVITEKHTLLSFHKTRRHTCVYVNQGFPQEGRTQLWHMEVLTTFITELRTLQAMPEAAHVRLGELRWALTETVFSEAVTSFGVHDRLEVWKQEMHNLSQKWGELALGRSFLVESLNWPRKLLKGFEGKGAGRLIEPAWQVWSSAVSQECTREQAAKSAKSAWDAKVREFNFRGEIIEGSDEMFETVIKGFERELKAVCRQADQAPRVLVANWDRYRPWSGRREEIDRITYSYGSIESRTDTSGDKWASILPEPVAEWLALRTPGLIWLGEFSKNDESVADTFVHLWEPAANDGAFAGAQDALASAWAL